MKHNILYLFIYICRHIKATSPKFNLILNLSCCGMFITGLLIVVFYYFGVKGYYKMAIGPLYDVRIVHTKYCSFVYELCLYGTQIVYTIWYYLLHCFFYIVGEKISDYISIFHNSRNKNSVNINPIIHIL